MDIDIETIRRRIDKARNNGVVPGTVLEVDWSHLPAEPGPAGGGIDALLANLRGKPLDLRETIIALDEAADDDRIAGLVARVQHTEGTVAVVQELRDAIGRFRAAGKTTTAFSENMDGNQAYLLASAFEDVVVLEAGGIGMVGVGMATTFLGETLPWAGLQPEFLQRYEYKNMANVFTETDFTDAHREASERLIESMFDRMVADICDARNLDEAAVRTAFATGPHPAPTAVELGLIDRTGFRDEVWDTAKGDGELLYLSRYLHHVRNKPAGGKARAKARKKAPVIAVIQAVGNIASGKSGMKPGLPPGPGVGSDTFVSGVEAALADDDVKAVVVRVDSPGGSAIASEVMARAISRGRDAGTPFVSSMGSVAASGGYYVSAPCDRIVANPTTITGSIGVVMGKFVDAELRDKVKMSTKTITTSDNALLYSSLTPFSDAQRDLLDEELDRTYELFLRRVCEGRGMERDAVHAVARGRVWTGTDALEHGLVDRLGGFHDAIAEAKLLAGLDADAEVRVVGYPKSSPLDFLLKPENSEPIETQLLALVGSVAHRALLAYEQQAGLRGVQARLPYDVKVR